MKICILGPVITKERSGGVAVFDEGLFQGFQQLGVICHLVSLEKSSKLQNVVIGGRDHLFIGYHNRKKIKNFLIEEQPDMVICSLKYLTCAKHLKKYLKKDLHKKVLYLYHNISIH